MAFDSPEALDLANSGWAVLGACYVDGNRLPMCQAMGIEERFFTLEDQRAMWLAMNEDDVQAEDGRFDLLALRDALKRRGVDGMRIFQLINDAADTYANVSGGLSDASFTMHMPYHVKTLRDRANARLVRDAVALAEYQLTTGAPVHEVMEALKAKIAPAENDGEPEASWSSTVQSVLNDIATGEDLAGRVSLNLPTLDESLGGGVGPWLVVVLGRPGAGKTNFIMHNIAVPLLKAGRRCFFASIEMTKEELTKRLLMHESGVPTNRMRPDRMRDGEWSRMTKVADDIARWPMECADSLRNVSQVCARARVEHKKGDLGAVFVDYLQILDNGRDTPALDIAHSVHELRSLKKELGVPVFLLSQSTVESRRATGALTASSGKGAGEIESAADLMVILDRPNPTGDGSRASVATGKARHAAGMLLSDTQVRFNERKLMYEEITE